MVEFPCSKINLGLHVTGKRPDGYHNIETVFYPLPLCDILEVVPDPDGEAGSVSVELSGLPVAGDPESNLVVRAYRALERNHSLPAVRAYLHKCIPTGAGLGGGSSDGVSMLRILNRMAGLGLGDAEMKGYALELGSDCPFFLHPEPVSAKGRGEETEPLRLSLGGWYLKLYHPGTGISTAEAYRNVPVGPIAFSAGRIRELPVNEWPAVIRNDFEEFAIRQVPLIGRIKEILYASGAVYASMTGSGSAVFGLFDRETVSPPGLTRYLIWEGRL